MGKGLAALTFDEEYQKKRRQAMNAKPKTFQEGMARSGKGLVMVSNVLYIGSLSTEHRLKMEVIKTISIYMYI